MLIKWFKQPFLDLVVAHESKQQEMPLEIIVTTVQMLRDSKIKYLVLEKLFLNIKYAYIRSRTKNTLRDSYKHIFI